MRPGWFGELFAKRSFVLVLFVFAVGCLCHFLRLDVLPMGFYVDEASIGYNAHLIAETGADEHGIRWPLFFEAFGEYKNPLYIYLLAILFRIVGYSEWTTRALSAFCWLGGSLCLYMLAKRLFADPFTRVYVAICLTFTPWLFSLTRVSFEFVVLFPVLAFHLLALRRGFDETSPRWAFAAGIAIGLSLYAYTAFRLLSPLFVLAALCCYKEREFRKSQVLFLVGAAACAIPFAIYALEHFDNLTERFRAITYLNNPSSSFGDKVELFLQHYFGYFDVSFLATAGDSNRRHHTGFGGELLVPTAVLLALSLVNTYREGMDRFRWYVVIGLFLSVFPAALTNGIYNSIRGFAFPIFAILLSAYGLRGMTARISGVVVAATAVLACLYVGNYFLEYPTVSAVAFVNYDFKKTLSEALQGSPNRIVLSSDGDSPYINLKYFGSLIGTEVPLLIGDRKDARAGDAYISYDPQRGLRGMYQVEWVH